MAAVADGLPVRGHASGPTTRRSSIPQGTVSDLASITVANARGSYRITVAITGRIRTVRTG